MPFFSSCRHTIAFVSSYARTYRYLSPHPTFLSFRTQVEDINLVRDEDTGKSKGFAFLKYEDSRSCILAVDNLTGSKVRHALCRSYNFLLCRFVLSFPCSIVCIYILTLLRVLSWPYIPPQVLGRSIRVDHVENYRLPKHLAERENGQNNGNDLQASNIEKTAPGHAYQGQELASSFDISKGQDLFAGPTVEESKADGERINPNGEEGMSKEERRQAKQARKEARDQKRREKEQRRMRKEEKRRERRARHMKGGGKEGGSARSRSTCSGDDEYEHDGSSGARRRSESSKRDRKSKKKHRRPSASRSRSYDRYSSDGESRSSSSHGSARKRRRRTEGGR